MPAIIATNPFDDDDDSVGGQQPQISTNPFDEIENQDPLVVNSAGSNPFDAPDPKTNNQAAEAAAEASWQYLGDLPYRRVPIYSNVRWDTTTTTGGGNGKSKDVYYRHGLASFPTAALKQHQLLNTPRELRQLLNTTTTTRVVACPHGGPICVVTLPVAGAASGFSHTELRILTNAGKPLAVLDFPPDNLDSTRYTPADILQIGFTSRTILILVLKDSLCLTFNLKGETVLEPFFIFQRENQQRSNLVEAKIYEGGVAVLAQNKTSALVELLDDFDDVEAYAQSAHVTARTISTASHATETTRPYYYALITELPTAGYASANGFAYRTLAVLPRSRTPSRHPEVYLSTNDNSVIVVQASTCQMTDVNCRTEISSPIVDMCFAPNGRFLACFTESAMLTVISSSFENKVLDFDTSDGSLSPPLAMQWCGEDSVVLHWKNLGVLMVGPYGDWLRFPYDGQDAVYILPEMDCCRVLTDSCVELLQRVPPATALLLRIGSIETSAMLLDAADAFYAGSPASDDEAAKAIVKMDEAIETCTEAAAREFDIPTQKRLLRAASYGMQFSYKQQHEQIMGGGPPTGSVENVELLPSSTATKFVATGRKLRVLNALQNPDVGFVLTSAQYDAITPAGVVARLIAMQRPALAAAICQYLGLPRAVQLYAKASKAAALVEAAASSNLSDSEIAEQAIAIVSGSMNRGAYATVAMAASKAGRPGVANLLLLLESSVADKVPALIAAGSYADAMAVATSARDADFIFSTLMEYEQACMSSASADISVAQATFLGTVVTKFTPEAFHTLRRYYGTTADVKSVTNLLVRAQRFTDAGSAMALRAVAETDPREKQGILTEASRVFDLGKETTLYKSCTDDYLELLKDQEILRTKYNTPRIIPDGSSSVTNTIASVIQYGATEPREQHRLILDADRLAKKFRIPEKRLWHIKVKALRDSQQWANLRLLAESKTKSPIGYKPFARAAIHGKQSEEQILKYIERVSSPEERFGLLCEATLWKAALEEAYKMRDGGLILTVKQKCNSPELQLQADQMLGRLA